MLAVEAAKECEGEIVNADAFQAYRGLDILTAKPGPEAQCRVRHHFFSAVELSETMSAIKFRELASMAFTDIAARGKTAIVVSGSGLYVKALAQGFDKVPPPSPKLRQELSVLSLHQLANRLRGIDPEFASRTDLNNRRRVVRAIEIAEGKARSESVEMAPRDPSVPLRFARDDERFESGRGRGVLLTRDRDDLYARINERVLAMFRDGVEGEVAALKNVGPTAAQALGLRQIQQLLAGEISRDQCIAIIQQKTRQYAKRQLTWFRHQTNFPQLNLTALPHREALRAITHAIAPE